MPSAPCSNGRQWDGSSLLSTTSVPTAKPPCACWKRNEPRLGGDSCRARRLAGSPVHETGMAMKVTCTVVNGEVLSENRGGVKRDYLPDPLGSTVALLDNTQTKTDTFTYWPYGET